MAPSLRPPPACHLAQGADLAGRKPDEVAIEGAQDLRHALRLGEVCMFGQVQRLAMRGHGDFRTHPGIHFRHLRPARMAGDVHQRGAVGHHLDARGHERIDDLADRLFIAGNGARRKDYGVSGVQFRRRMRRPQRCARAPRAARPGSRWRGQNPVTRQALERIHAQ